MKDIPFSEVISCPFGKLFSVQSLKEVLTGELYREFFCFFFNIHPVGKARGAFGYIDCAQITGPFVYIAKQVFVYALHMRKVEGFIAIFQRDFSKLRCANCNKTPFKCLKLGLIVKAELVLHYARFSVQIIVV